jgi:hypothetical protein
MHDRTVVAEALRLRDEEDLGPARVARRLGISARTVRDWNAGKVPHVARDLLGGGEPPCPQCGLGPHGFADLPPEYVYLLGLYLGDGAIARHPRGVYRLRVFLALAYPRIIETCASAMAAVNPGRKVGRLERGGSFVPAGPASNVELSSYWKSWPCLFPQHGPGRKHKRRIWLSKWQQLLAERWPELLLRGLIHSDGCRFANTRGSRDTWTAPRYAFTNCSTDITSIFCSACDVLGLRWTAHSRRTRRKP